MVLCKLREVRSIRPGELDLIESVLSLVPNQLPRKYSENSTLPPHSSLGLVSYLSKLISSQRSHQRTVLNSFSLGAIVTSLLSVLIFPRFTCNSSPDANDSPCDPKSENRGWRVLLGCLGVIVSFLLSLPFARELSLLSVGNYPERPHVPRSSSLLQVTRKS